MRLQHLGLLLVSAIAAGCVSFARLDAPKLTPDQCVTDRALVGTWTDARMTQMGPAWVKLSLKADCTSAMRISMLFAWITERGHYRAGDGQIVFERKSGQTIWPYRFDGVRLHVTEYPGEVHVYSR
jgi:hypothetical protein